MKLIEALNILRKAPSESAEKFVVSLVCGFTPLHLETLLAAQLQKLDPERRIKIHTGLYGDFMGNLERAAESGPTAIAVTMEWQDLDPRLGIRSLGGWLPDVLPNIIENVRVRLASIESVLQRISREVPVAICFPTLPFPPISYTPGWQASSFEMEVRARVASTVDRAVRFPNVNVVNPQQLDLLAPSGQRFDVSSEILTGFPYRLSHASVLAELLSQLINGPTPKKGLITDLDDTVWQGILGEVGPEGVSWDLEHHSQMHALYQQLLQALSAEGVLVAIASKNDPKLVAEVFNKRSPILPESAVFPIEAHWGPKSESVGRILKAWKIGADSVVFIDDSAMELAEVKQAHAAVECLPFPQGDAAGIYELLRRLRDLFGKSAIREEDAIRLASLRQAEAIPRGEVVSESTRENFLEQAEAELTITFAKETLDPRALELVNKTNQFNLNGKRHTQTSLQSYARDSNAFLMVVSYKDKYGPLGKIAVIAGHFVAKTLSIDTWVMSCRAFARRIEHRCLDELIAKFSPDEIEFDFTETPRNGPIRTFLIEALGVPLESPHRVSSKVFLERRQRTYHRILETIDG
jgi:FkbH-like protein